MATRKPLVVVSGAIQELPTGDSIEGTSGTTQSISSTVFSEVLDSASISAGATWESVSGIGTGWYDISYANGVFVAVSPTVASGTKIRYSYDGKTWNNCINIDSSSWCAVAYGNGRFVAVSFAGSNRIAYSYDGITWTNVTSAVAWNDIEFGNNTFIAITNSGAVSTSPDGITWTSRTALPATSSYEHISYGAGLFVVVGQTSHIARASIDGTSWTDLAIPTTNAWYDVAYGNGKFVVVGTNGAAVYEPGIGWSAATISAGAYKKVTFGNGLFIASTGNDNNTATSYDGITWNNSTAILPSGHSSARGCYGNGIFVLGLIGSGTGFLVSKDKYRLQPALVSGTTIKTINSTSLLGSGNIDLQEALVSGTTIKTVNSQSLLGSGNINIAAAAGGIDGAVQFNNAGSLDGAANVDIHNGDLTLATVASPTTPPVGTVKLFARSLGGRNMPAIVGPSGLDTVLQPHMARNGWAQWKPSTGTTISAIGAAALTAVGTATAAAYATTSLHTRSTRVDYLVTTAATTAVAGFRIATNAYRPTDGFHMLFRVAPATGTTLSTKRFFCGMSASAAAPTDVNPSTLTDIAGVGYDAADANWQIFFNDNAGTATKVDTGMTRPSTDRPGPYSVVVWCPPGRAYIGVRFTDESTGVAFETQATTDLMTTTTACGPRGYASVGGTSSVVGFTLFSGYMETDN